MLTMAGHSMKQQHGTWLVTRTFHGDLSKTAAENLQLSHERRSSTRLLLGRHEWISFPSLGVGPIIAKSDSGARTSSLHAENIRVESDDNTVTFDTRSQDHQLISCRAEIIYSKKIKNSGGFSRERIVIQTIAEFAGGLSIPIKITLADRSNMRCPALLGRRALSGFFMIDPQSSFLLGAWNEMPPKP